MSYGCLLLNNMRLIVDIIFDKTSNAVNIQMTGPNETVLAYFNHALNMIANLWWSNKFSMLLFVTFC